MGIFGLLMLSAGLAMDAFSVSVCRGLSAKKPRLSDAAVTALFFGVFQAIMPLIGYLVGCGFGDRFERYDHWIAFVLLGAIGLKMLVGALGNGSSESIGSPTDLRELTALAIATSIDALAVGVVFAVQETALLSSVAVIGAVTFALSFTGVLIGGKFGGIFGKKAEIAGGIVLMLIGVKLLLDGLR